MSVRSIHSEGLRIAAEARPQELGRGYGLSIWQSKNHDFLQELSLDISDQDSLYPEAEVIGTDLSPIQPEW